MIKKITIESTNAGERLDKFLTSVWEGQTRSQIKKKILAGNFLVNNEISTVHYFLRIGDQITVAAKNNLPKQPRKTKPKGMNLEIIVETPDYLVINKPAGLLVHPINENDRDFTLVDLLIKKHPELKKVGDEPNLRPGIVHRLDRDVSGLMVVPRNQKMFELLKNQFKNRLIKKNYTALAHGQLPKTDGVIDFPIERSRNNPRMAAKTKQQSEREAITSYQVIEYLGGTKGEFHGYSLLQVNIKTGRTNQIRVHLAAINHPIVGDKIYGNKKYKPANIGRILLYSSELGFFDLSDNWQEFKIDKVKEIDEFIKTRLK